MAIGSPFIPSFDELRAFSAELWLIAAIVAVLIAPFFTRRANLLCGWIALGGVGMALLSTLAAGVSSPMVGEHFRGLLVFDRVAFFWKTILLLFVAGVIGLWFATTSRRFHEGDGPEFFTLLLGATLGMCVMAETSNLLMIFMAVELASLPSYVLAGFRKTHRLGAEASLKYVLFGATTSSIMVYGLSFLYGIYGTLQVGQLAAGMMGGGNHTGLLVTAIFGLVVGVGFKIAAVPFHFWCPDVFEGASVDVTAFLSVASKGAGLILLLRVLETFAAVSNFSNSALLSTLAMVVGTLGAVTATVGNTAAFGQTNIKRLLAYSSIAHAGYMLCAVSLLVKGAAAGDSFIPANAAAQAILLYLAVYAFMNLGAFTITALVGAYTGGETLAHFRGLGQRAPLLAICMFCCLISLIGLPPFAGFNAKLYVLWALFQNGGWGWILIVVIAVNTILSAFYYFSILGAMFLQSGDGPEMNPNSLGTFLSVTCAGVLVLLFLAFGPVSRMTSQFGQLYLGEGSAQGSTLDAGHSTPKLKEQASAPFPAAEH